MKVKMLVTGQHVCYFISNSCEKILYLCVCYYAPYNGCVYIYVYIYIYREREREKTEKRKRGKEKENKYIYLMQ